MKLFQLATALPVQPATRLPATATRAVTLAAIIATGGDAAIQAAVSDESDTLARGTPATELAGRQEHSADELKSLADPTVIVRRVWSDTEWNKYADGRHLVEEGVNGLWAWRLSENQDWGVRLKVPYKWQVAGGAPGYTDDQGFGDVEFATGTAGRLSESWRIGGGVMIHTPTAEAGFGDNLWRIQEFLAVAWDTTPWLTFSPSVEYNQSFQEEPGIAAQHYLEAYFPVTFLLPHQWSVSPRYEFKVDFNDDNYVTHTAKFLVAKQLVNPPLGIAASIKRSFDSGEKDFTVNFILTYYFR